ncbi:hypothetical protein [Streptomyces cirratus]|uniref:hypothetical protein n=1 Tax=Streptomyces cirratus TaxID=68187 RepID=UPI0036099911
MTVTVRRRIPRLICASCISSALLVSAGAATAVAASQSPTNASVQTAPRDDTGDTGGGDADNHNTDTGDTGGGDADNHNTDTGDTGGGDADNHNTGSISSERDRRLACENADRTWVETNNGSYCDLHTYKKTEQPNLNERLRLCLTVKSHSGCRATADKYVIGGNEPVAGAKCTLSLAGVAQPKIGKWALTMKGGKAFGVAQWLQLGP